MPEIRHGAGKNRNEAVHERRIEADGHHTRVLEVDGNGPLILLLHGFADSSDTWRDLLAELGARGHRGAAVDLPGFGRADGIARTGTLLGTYDSFVTAVIEVLREPGDGPVVVVGNSMGATVALRAAGEREDVAAVVGLAPAGLGFQRELHLANGALKAILPVLRIAYQVPYPTLAVQLAVATYYRVRLASGISNAWRFGSHFRGMSEFRRVGVLGRRLMTEVESGCLELDTIARPVTLIWGDRDPVCDPGGARTLLDAVPGSHLVLIDGGGHLPQIDQPHTVAGIIASIADETAHRTDASEADIDIRRHEGQGQQSDE